MNTRRQFLLQAPVGMLAAAAACRGTEQSPVTATATTGTPGAPPTVGTSAAAGPAVTAESFAAAETLMQVRMTDAERTQAAVNWPKWLKSKAPCSTARSTSWKNTSGSCCCQKMPPTAAM